MTNTVVSIFIMRQTARDIEKTQTNYDIAQNEYCIQAYALAQHYRRKQ